MVKRLETIDRRTKALQDKDKFFGFKRVFVNGALVPRGQKRESRKLGATQIIRSRRR